MPNTIGESGVTNLSGSIVRPQWLLRRCGKARGAECSRSYMTDEQRSPQQRRNHPQGVLVRLAAGVALP